MVVNTKHVRKRYEVGEPCSSPGPSRCTACHKAKMCPKDPGGPFLCIFVFKEARLKPRRRRTTHTAGTNAYLWTLKPLWNLIAFIDAHRFTQTPLQATYTSTMRIKKNIPIFHILLMRIAAKYLPYLFAPPIQHSAIVPTAHTTHQTTPQPLQYTIISLQTLHSSRCSACIRIN